jgi:Transposase, Mutator family
VSIRLGEDDRLCLLVVTGVREDATKELLAVEDGYRESTESWASVMRDLKARGINEPKLVVGDGALGTWAALRDVFPGARRQASAVDARWWMRAIAASRCEARTHARSSGVTVSGTASGVRVERSAAWAVRSGSWRRSSSTSARASASLFRVAARARRVSATVAARAAAMCA